MLAKGMNNNRGGTINSFGSYLFSLVVFHSKVCTCVCVRIRVSVYVYICISILVCVCVHSYICIYSCFFSGCLCEEICYIYIIYILFEKYADR